MSTIRNEEVAPETKGVTAELLTTVDLGSEIEGMAGRPSGPSALTARKPAAQPPLHMAAVTQIRNPGTDGRIYFERKVAEGKTKKEALRSLKRQISNAVYRQLLLDAR